jgi:hypothetical protein
VLGNTLATAAAELVACARAIDASRDAIRRKTRVGIREDAIVGSLGDGRERREEGGGNEGGVVEGGGGEGWNFCTCMETEYLVWFVSTFGAGLGFSLGLPAPRFFERLGDGQGLSVHVLGRLRNTILRFSHGSGDGGCWCCKAEELFS